MTRRELFDVIELLVEDHPGDFEDLCNARGTVDLSPSETFAEYENLVDELACKVLHALMVADLPPPKMTGRLR